MRCLLFPKLFGFLMESNDGILCGQDSFDASFMSRDLTIIQCFVPVIIISPYWFNLFFLLDYFIAAASFPKRRYFSLLDTYKHDFLNFSVILALEKIEFLLVVILFV